MVAAFSIDMYPLTRILRTLPVKAFMSIEYAMQQNKHVPRAFISIERMKDNAILARRACISIEYTYNTTIHSRRGFIN
jgi:hypothetical protein